MQRPDGKLPLPLEGTRVLDATHIVAGPFCSLILADMGAEVIKIERPGVGELNRRRGAMVQGPGDQRVSSRFLGLNRNKKSVTLDLRDPLCKHAFENMLRTSDVLLDNWGPGALDRLGFSYQHLSEINPGLIYATISGYGGHPESQGPYSEWPANNLCVQAMGGWMAMNGAAGGTPQGVGENIGDSIPGLWTALGIVLALETRRKTGMGQHVDMAMYECMAAHTLSTMAGYQSTGYDGPPTEENAIGAGLVIRARDGYVVMAGARPEESWTALWRLLGREDLLQDPRYRGQGADPEFYRRNIVPAIEQWSQDLDREDVCRQLTQTGVSMGMVQTMGDLDRCPHLEARGSFVDAGDTFGGSYRTLKTPLSLTRCEDIPANPPPTLGSSNQDILCGIGGLTGQELDQLQRRGAV
jgi:crotonobetainyl-CoA:carnitine CoA-transferase CaiB-like acyl-CoA transferase